VNAEIEVEDNGPGIPPERMEHLFEPFFTTKETGMGMGLPISQTILENHNGCIWAESAPGRGAVFHVTLPVVGTGSGLLTGREARASIPEAAESG
jgi:two-component system sensor kinase FixL